MLEILTGPFHPSLEQAFVERLRELKKDDPLAPVCIVAPSLRLATRLKELALEAFPQGVAALHFHHLMSFARLAAGDAAPVQDDLVLEKLVARIVARDFPNARYLSGVPESPGRARFILHLLMELREGGLDPGDSYRALQEGELGSEDPLKLGEVFALLQAYETELARRDWMDRAGMVRLAAERAPQSAQLGAFREIIYYGFLELVQVQIDLFHAVARNFAARLFYPLEAGNPGYAFTQSFYTEVLAGAAASRRDLDPNLRTRNLFAGGQVEARIVHASGPRDEVWACAKQILKWRQEGVPFDQIGVVARSLEPYEIHVESLFRENRIPHSAGDSVLPERHPYVSAVRALLTLADGEFPRDAMMDLLSSPHFRCPEPPEAVLWDMLTRARGIGRGADEWRRRLPPEGEFVLERGARDERRSFRVGARQVRLLRESVERLLTRAVPPEAVGWLRYADWLAELLDELLDPLGSEEVASSVRDAFAGLARLETIGEAPSPTELRETALRCLADARKPAGRGGGVRVVDVMSARGLAFRKLWVLGLNERVFPRFILEDPFVRDAVRARIAARLGPRLPQKLRGYDEERLLFTLLAASCEELVLSWQRSDDQGRVQVKSLFLREAVGREDQVPRRPAERLRAVDVLHLTRKEAALRAALSARNVELLARDADLERGLEFLERIESARTAGACDGRIGIRGHGETVSPTALETFATCPFKYFSERVMNLEELDEPELELQTSALEEGEIYHAFLQRFWERLDGRVPASIEEAAPLFETTLREVFDQLPGARTIRHPLLWEIERSRMRAVLEAAVRHDMAARGGFHPWRFELEIQADLGVGVRVKGILDRLDLRPDGAFRVIDYKRSWSKNRYPWKTMATGVLEHGRYFQPPLYFLLAEKFLEKQGKPPKRAESCSGYLFLRELAEGEPAQLWLEGDFWKHEKAFFGILGRVLGSMDRGEFVLRADPQHCAACAMSVVCRKQHGPTRRRADRFHGGAHGGDALRLRSGQGVRGEK
ncbi:MAG: PD-(D/E)XK nuclease family protein [Planctomycetes bacterium]|nr:PD-(D/E)XK nuclease family protein [Planctomycetota bacterium]